MQTQQAIRLARRWREIYPSSFFYLCMLFSREDDKQRQEKIACPNITHEVCHMSNLIIHYLHRDEGNWKDHLNVCIQNPAGYPASEAEQMIRELLIDREYFYPEELGLEKSEYAERGDWHEFESVEMAADESKPSAITLETLLDNLRKSNQNFLNAKPIKIHKIPAGIPLGLAISWLEFLRETRAYLSTIIALIRKDSVVVVFRSDDDWNLVEETLRLDTNSGNFDNDLRKSITRALNGMKELIGFPDFIKKLYRKSGELQKKTEKVVRQ